MQDEKYHELDKKVSVIENDIRTIKDNHLAHIEKDMDTVLAKLEQMDSRMFGLLTASLCILVAAVGALVVMGLNFGN